MCERSVCLLLSLFLPDFGVIMLSAAAGEAGDWPCRPGGSGDRDECHKLEKL